MDTAGIYKYEVDLGEDEVDCDSLGCKQLKQ